MDTSIGFRVVIAGLLGFGCVSAGDKSEARASLGGAPVGSVSLWSDATVPSVAAWDDPNPVELGVKFRSSVAGDVSAIRFYRGEQDNPPYLVHLWSASGEQLAEAGAFEGLPGPVPGWQNISLATPVHLDANTPYIASYYAPGGNYAADGDYFTSAVVSGPLTAPSSSESGGNGVYHYGSGGGFPTDTYGSANYWVDVVFTPAATGPKPRAPSQLIVEAVAPHDVRLRWFGAVEGGGESANVTPEHLVYRDGVLIATTTNRHTSFRDESAPAGAHVVYTVIGRSSGGVLSDPAPAASDDTPTERTGADCPCSVLYPLTTPQYSGAPGAIEVGQPIRVQDASQISALRFLNESVVAGEPRTLHVWSADGTLLRTVDTTSGGVVGWQTVTLPAPLAVTAGEQLVVSLYTETGGYGVTYNFFDDGPLDYAPLQTGAGVVHRGASGFPTVAEYGAVYFVDVVIDQY